MLSSFHLVRKYLNKSFTVESVSCLCRPIAASRNNVDLMTVTPLHPRLITLTRLTTMRATYVTTLILSTALFLAPNAFGQRADDADRASKNGKTEATIDGVDVTIEYGRPNVKERDVWGALVPMGELWRTGANEATTISFSADVTVEGNALSAGTYSLFTIPGEDAWTVIFNNVASQWGAFNYDSEEDALRVPVAPVEIEHVESMDFAVDGSTVMLRWEKVGVPFAVAAAETD